MTMPAMRSMMPYGRSLVAALALALAGCSAAPTAVVVDDDPGLPPTPTYSPTEAAFAANINPLSGLPSETEDVAGRRPEAVTIRLLPDYARGVSWIQSIELVFWSLLRLRTRLPLGVLRHPVLTALTLEPTERHPQSPYVLGAADALDVAVVRSFRAHLTTAMASEELVGELNADGLSVSRGEDTFIRPTASPAEPPPPLRWGFSEHPLGPIDRPAETVTLATADSGDVVIRLDRALGVWRMGRRVPAASGEGTDADTASADVESPLIPPGEDEAPLAIANILILTLPEADPEATDLGWHGEGPATLLRDGVAQSGRWSRPDPRQPFGLVNAEGLAMALRPGNTWVLLAPAETAIEIAGGN